MDLQDGFTGNETILRLDGKEVFRGHPRTKMQTGMAKILPFDLPPGRVLLNIEFPAEALSASHTIDLDREVFIGISVTAEGSITFKPSAEPFGYV